jgi:cell division transport system permease protein
MAREFTSTRGEPEVPSNTLTYFFREALRRLWVSKRTSFVAVAMIAMSLFILGAFLLIAENLQRAVTRWQGRSHVNVFFDNDATPDQIHAVDGYLAAHPDLRTRHFVTPAQALVQFKRDFANLSDVVNQLDQNPFPASFEIDVVRGAVNPSKFDREVGELRAMSGVEQVQYDWEWVKRLQRLIDILNLVGLIAGGVLALAAAFTIANVIRLTMMMYREEIEIMRLVGATERIIRGPFLLEGIVQGTIGGAFAVGLLYAVFEISRRMIAPSSSMLWGFLFATFLPWQKIAALVAGGMLSGWLGSWLSVRERVIEES